MDVDTLFGKLDALAGLTLKNPSNDAFSPTWRKDRSSSFSPRGATRAVTTPRHGPIACLSCFKLLRIGEKFCGNCGALASEIGTGSDIGSGSESLGSDLDARVNALLEAPAKQAGQEYGNQADAKQTNAEARFEALLTSKMSSFG